MNPEVEKIHQDYVGRLKRFADDADCLTDGNKSKFANLLIKEYNRDLSRIVKKETFIQKIVNKLFKRRLRAEKQSFVKVQQEPTFSCSDCIHSAVFDGLTCCTAHKLVFDNIERQQQFCLQFCRSYSEEQTDDCSDVTDDKTTVSAETPDEQEECTDEETVTNNEEQEIEDETFVPCAKCPSCRQDENGEYYCDRYNEELDSDTVADVRQCEE